MPAPEGAVEARRTVPFAGRGQHFSQLELLVVWFPGTAQRRPRGMVRGSDQCGRGSAGVLPGDRSQSRQHHDRHDGSGLDLGRTDSSEPRAEQSEQRIAGRGCPGVPLGSIDEQAQQGRGGKVPPEHSRLMARAERQVPHQLDRHQARDTHRRRAPLGQDTPMNKRGERGDQYQAHKPRVQVCARGRPRCSDHEEP